MYLLYDEVSPFTAERRVFVEYDSAIGDHMMLCMDTGYQSYRLMWREDSPIHEMMRDSIPSLIWDTRQILDGRVWYKLHLLTATVELVPEFNDIEERWAVYPLKNGVETDSDIRRVVAVAENGDYDPDDPDVVYYYRVRDYENALYYPITQFEVAFNAAQEIKSVGHEVFNNEIQKKDSQ